MNLVQPILVDSAGTHEDTIFCVAYASYQAFNYNPFHETWNLWLKGKFTKSVRRASADTIEKIIRYPTRHYHRVTCNTSQAAAFNPMTEFPKDIARCQVSGTDFPRMGFKDPLDKGHLIIAINPTVEMTTGKTAAQAAHALFGYYLKNPNVKNDPFVFTEDREVFEILKKKEESVLIHDAGLTEVEPNTLTCIAGFL